MNAKRLSIADLRGYDAAERLIYNAAHDGGNTGIRLEMGNTQGVFPNGAVPFAAAFQYFRRTGYKLSVGAVSTDVINAHLLNPLPAATFPETVGRVTNTVWEYTSVQEANLLTNGFTRAIEENVRCETGVIDSLTWCIYEVLDNVFQHSKASSGYVMMQIHTKNRMCAIAVSDTGIGIHKSFIDAGVYRTNNAYDALKLAVQERVTSKPKNMGNGLYGLIRVVGLNGGRLAIRSGRGALEFRENRLTGEARLSRPVMEPNLHQGTTVDWQLNMAHAVSISAALDTPYPGESHTEAIEDDEGEHRLYVREFEESLGARTSAENIRLRLENYLADGVPKIVLDFRGITIVSSSFADEVLGKLALEQGEDVFRRRLRLDNASHEIRGIIERAVVQRLEEGDEAHPARRRSELPRRATEGLS